MKCSYAYKIIDEKTGDEFNKECKYKATTYLKHEGKPICKKCRKKIKKLSKETDVILEPLTSMELTQYVGMKEDDDYAKKLAPVKKKIEKKLMKKHMKKQLGISEWGLSFNKRKELINARKQMETQNEKEVKTKK